jgi:MoaA/NifB/PqqE/SkfB family radical SAM enzyme
VTRCTRPWTDLYLRWDLASCCCFLAAKRRQRTPLWGSLDSVGAVFNSPLFQEIREEMSREGAAAVCDGCLRCNDLATDDSVDTDSRVVLAPKRITVTTSLICQADCAYCQVPCSKLSPKRPPRAKVEAFCESLSDVRSVVYTGGDLFALTDDLIGVWMEPVVKHGLDCLIITNGIGLTQVRYDRWCRHPGVRLSITLDTLNPTVYRKQRGPQGWLTVHDRLARIAQSAPGNRIQANATVTGLNLHCVSNLIRWAGDVGITHLLVNPVEPTTRFRRHAHASIFGPGCTERSYLQVRLRVLEWIDVAAKAGVHLIGVERMRRVNEAAWTAQQKEAPAVT